MPLHETQTIFWQLLAAPEGPEQGLKALEDSERRLPGGLESLVVDDGPLRAIDRVGIYANMYFFRILDVLRDDYPAVAALLGEDRFHNLVTDYLWAHPSTHPSLRWAGAKLASFLETHAESGIRPDLADLARLEWARVGAFDAPDARPLTADVLQTMPPEAWAAARFRTTPSLEIVESEWDVASVWRAAHDEGPAPDPERASQAIRVWRRGFRVVHREIDPLELTALRAVAAGDEFGAVCERVADRVGDVEAAARVVGFLRGWIADELLVG